MFIDVFECFKKANTEISDALRYAYPENMLNKAHGEQAMHRIDGIAKSLKIVMANKLEGEKAEKEEEFRNVFSETGEEHEKMQSDEEELEYLVNWNSILELYPDSLIKTFDFYKKTGDSALHACLQAITGKVEIMNLFLNAIVYSSR